MDLFSESFGQALLLLEESGSDGMPPLLRPVQQDAASRFMAQGLPTIRHEDWKYTNLLPLSKRLVVTICVFRSRRSPGPGKVISRSGHGDRSSERSDA